MSTSLFARTLASIPVAAAPATWRFVPYDQLSLRLGGLDQLGPSARGLLLVECPEKAARRPYHQQKLALVLANLRQFALEAARAGWAVRHVVAPSYADAVARLAAELGPVEVCEPAERELRVELRPLVADGRLRVLRHDGWLTEPEDLGAGPSWRMDAFYRRARARSGLLMVDGKPEGGKWSYDVDNRLRWDGIPAAPTPPVFTPDAITAEVLDLVRRRFGDHPGRLDPAALPATADDARAQWQWALTRCLRDFGPYEDAMSSRSRTLFHTRVAPLLHLHRLWPADVVADAARADAPLASREGFVRQVLGWREFVRHVHVATDGLRRAEGLRAAPTDGGWASWRAAADDDAAPTDGGRAPWRAAAPDAPATDADANATVANSAASPTDRRWASWRGAANDNAANDVPKTDAGTTDNAANHNAANHTAADSSPSSPSPRDAGPRPSPDGAARAHAPPDAASPIAPGRPLPPAWWGRRSGLRCLDDVTRAVWEDGYSHHITRLMVLGNLATLLEVDARALTDWFWVAYTDAYDWVVEPNVLGMATFATPVMTTKPYICGSAYLDRMGDACASCRFDPRTTCPITPLYWAWLARHHDALRGNPRMAQVLASLRKRAPEKVAADARVFAYASTRLALGLELEPAGVTAALSGG
jgi:deoxyribodipyrimidine photolyase-related protein